MKMVANDLLDENLEGEITDEGDEDIEDEAQGTIDKKKYDEVKKQLTESTKEGQALNWMLNINNDKFAFIKLFEADKKMAEYVAKKFGDARKPTDIVRDLKAEKNGGTPSDKSKSVDDVEQLLNEREAKATLKSMQKEYKLDIKGNDKVKEAIMDEFEDLIDGKEYNSDNVEKYFKKAVRIVKKLDQHEEKLSLIESELQGAGAIGGIKGDNGAKKGDYFSQFDKGNHTSRY